jgi:hypothetical protein
MAIWRATITGHLFGQVCQNVLHFAKDVTVDHDDLFLAQSLRDNWCNQIGFRMGDEASIDLVEVRDLQDTNRPPILLPVQVHGSMGGIRNTFPFAAFKIRLHTAATGRKGRGRFYVWGIGPGAMQDGLLQAGVFDQWAGTLQTLKNKFGPAPETGYSLVISPRNQPTDFKTVVDMVLSPTPGVIRRRNIGVGR